MAELGIGAGAVSAVAAAATVVLTRGRRRGGATVGGIATGRPAPQIHPYLRPPALQGALKGRSVFVDDWRARRA